MYIFWTLFAFWFLQPSEAHARRYSTPAWESKFIDCKNCWGSSSADHRITVPASNAYLVENCAKEASRKQVVKVNYFSEQLCKKNFFRDSTHGTQVLYWLKRNGNRVNVTMKLHFLISEDGKKMKPSKERAKEMLKNVRACIPEIQKVWMRYGIEMNLQFDSDFEPTLTGEKLDILLIDDSGRSYANKYMYYGYDHGDGLESDRQNDFCSTLAHETGHTLGFDDEYKDTDCPDRPFLAAESAPPYSVMNTHWKSWGELEYYPRHVALLVAPLCGWNDYVDLLD